MIGGTARYIPERQEMPAVRFHFVAFLLAAVVAVWIYVPAVDSYLVNDDFQWIEGAMTASVARILTVNDRVHFYRPAIEAYFAAMHASFGCSARALHIASVALHLINTGLVMALAILLVGRSSYAAIAGVLFATQPGPAEAVLWPSAVTTLLCATFGLSMLVADVRRSGRGGMVLVTLAFAGALACHESGVMFLPAAVLLRHVRGEQRPLLSWLREYLPSLLLLGVYVPLTAWINLRNYVVTQGYYAIGPHIGENFLNYLVSLYAGQRRTADYVFAIAAGGALMSKAAPRVRAWCFWIVIALLPALPFAWGTASRYLYVATIPFCFLLAEGALWLHHTLARTLPARRVLVGAITVAVVAFLVGRSASFARKGAESFHAAAEPYRLLAENVRRTVDGRVHLDTRAFASIPALYVTPLARTAVCDPGVAVDVP
jgi:hypothetical protein